MSFSTRWWVWLGFIMEQGFLFLGGEDLSEMGLE